MRRIEINEAYMRGLIRSDIATRGINQSEWADLKGFSRQFISEVLAGKRNVTAKLAEAMGYERHIIFKRASPSTAGRSK